MRRVVVSSAALLVVTAGVVMAAELTSGVEVGGSAEFFQVLDVTGPKAGSKLCYR